MGIQRTKCLNCETTQGPFRRHDQYGPFKGPLCIKVEECAERRKKLDIQRYDKG